MSLFNLLKKQVNKNPKKLAIVLDDVEYTYEKLLSMIIKIIIIFRKNGIKKNDKVLIFEDNTIFHVLTLFATSFLNFTLVPLGTSYSAQQVKKFIKITNTNCLIGNSNYLKSFTKLKQIKVNIKTDKIDLINIKLNTKYLKKYEQEKINLKKLYYFYDLGLYIRAKALSLFTKY